MRASILPLALCGLREKSSEPVPCWSADAAWPHGWEHCVGHLELEGAWSKLVCWDGAHSNVPRWLPAANPTEDEIIAEMSVARQERRRSWRQNHTTTLSRWERSDSVWDTVRDADHSRSGYYSPGRADDQGARRGAREDRGHRGPRRRRSGLLPLRVLHLPPLLPPSLPRKDCRQRGRGRGRRTQRSW